MSFIAIDADLEDHPKFHALISRRRWCAERGLAFLYRFWRTVRRHAPDGRLVGWTDEYVATQTRMGKLAGLIEDLVACGLLDREGDLLVVHGWHERNGKHIRSNLKKEQRSAGGTNRASTATRNAQGQFVLESGPGVIPAVTPGNDPGVDRWTPGPCKPSEHEPEPQPEPGPSTSLSPSSRFGASTKLLPSVNVTLTKTNSLESFKAFWSAYPKKVARRKAEQVWKRLRVHGPLVEAIMTGLARYKAEWAGKDVQFIPHPAKWLEDRRWEDGPSEAIPAPGVREGERVSRDPKLVEMDGWRQQWEREQEEAP
jgi:hypothetical protein